MYEYININATAYFCYTLYVYTSLLHAYFVIMDIY